MSVTKGKKWGIRVLRVIGIVLLAVIILVAAFFIKAARTPAVPRNYIETVKTGGDIEEKYLKNGMYKTAYTEVGALQDYKKYEIYYPEELTSTDKKYPVIVVSNGTGVKGSKARAMFEHFASWGFIVIGNEEEYSWNGFASDMSLNYLLKCNHDGESIFYQKIDTDNIGSLGHSQGGVGAINAVTEAKHAAKYRTVVAESPANPELGAGLEWDYDISKVNIPIFMVAGTKGDFEMKTVIPSEKLPEMYAQITAPKAMARKKDCEHGEMLYSADGYVTAWFMWQLQGDKEAAGAFIGDKPELMNNELYQEQRIEFEINDSSGINASVKFLSGNE